MWYIKGKEAFNKIRQEEVLKQSQANAVPRFYLKPNEQADVIFVDSEGFMVYRHAIKRGDLFHEITCLGDMCPLCMAGERRFPVVFFTVIDTRPYTKPDGTTVKYTKKLLGAKRQLAMQIFDFIETYGNLSRAKATLKRYTENDASNGIILKWDMEGNKLKRYNIQSLGEYFTTPFNYMEILKPPTKEFLEALGYAIDTSMFEIPDIDETVEEEQVNEIKEEEPSLDDLMDDITL